MVGDVEVPKDRDRGDHAINGELAGAAENRRHVDDRRRQQANGATSTAMRPMHTENILRGLTGKGSHEIEIGTQKEFAPLARLQ